MSSTPQQPTSNVVDTGPLSWVLGEIREALARSEQAIDAFSKSDGMDTTQLHAAKSQLHLAHGALRVVDIDGVSVVTEEAEHLYEFFENEPKLCTATAVEEIHRAFLAVVEYLQDLMNGQAHQPIRLFPYYRDLLAVRSAERIHPADLFFPDLSARPPVGAAPEQPLTAEQLARARANFERGLLSYLRDPEDQTAIESLYTAVSEIEQTQRSGPQRAFWWVTLAFVEALKAKALPAELNIKRLCARINLQMRSVLDGTSTVSERLLKDTLFFVARCADVSPRIGQVKQFYHLQEAIPHDFENPQYGKVDVRALTQARERLEAAKAAWTRLASGSLSDLKVFANEAVGMSQAVSELQQPELERLVNAIAQYGQSLQQGANALPEALGLEMATALLLAGMVLDDPKAMDEALAGRVDAMLERLKIAASGQIPEESLPWLAEIAQEAQQKLFMASVAHELQVSLTSVEKVMDTFFRDPTQKEGLAESLAILNQVAGALDLLGHTEAVAAVRVVQKDVETFIRPDYVPDAQQFNRVAQNCGALGFFAESLQKPPQAVTHQFKFDPTIGEFSAQLIEVSRPSSRASDNYADESFYDSGDESTRKPKPPGESKAQPSLAPGLGEPELVLGEFVPTSFNLQGEKSDFILDPITLGGDSGHYSATLPPTPSVPASRPLLDPARMTASATTTAGMSDAEIDAELLEIFLGEADEVLQSVNAALIEIKNSPENQELMTTIRRGFHTLKGSSRMVGLVEFGEAAWGLEQTMNLWLAERRSGTPALFELLHTAVDELNDWLADVRQTGNSTHTAQILVELAKQLRAPQEAAPISISQADEKNSDLSSQSRLQPEHYTERIAASEAHAEPELHVLPETEKSPNLEEILTNPPADIQVEEIEITAPVEFSPQENKQETDLHAAEFPIQYDAFAQEEVISIDGMAVSMPLYNIFLAEADDLIRVLALDFSEWRHEPERSASQIALRSSHSLTGSSATVGLQPVNILANALEALLQRIAKNPQPLINEDFDLLDQTAEMLRHMMHKFAAGQMPESAPELCGLLEILKQRFISPAAVFGETASLAEPSSVSSVPEIEIPAVVESVSPETSPALGTIEEPVSRPVATNFLSGGQQDEIDADLLPIFIEEAQDFFPQISQALRSWKNNPTDRAIPQQLLRYLHTIKGSARMAGAMRLGQLVHNMETRIETAMGLAQTPVGLMEDLQTAQDQAQFLFEALLNPASNNSQSVDASIPEVAPIKTPDPDLVTSSSTSEEAPIEATPTSLVEVDLGLSSTTLSPTPAAAPIAPMASTTAGALVRVRSDILDRLINQAGEVSIARSRVDTEITSMRTALSELTENMQRLRNQLREIEIQAEAQMAARVDSDHFREFDPLEFDRFTRFQEITRMMAESVNDLGAVHQNLLRSVEETEEDLHNQSRLTRELQQDLMSVRMVQFGSISERLYRVVRLASKELDKRVNLDIRGLQVELDRGVLEKMAGPFEHLLRNAVAHGIETRDARRAAEKSEAGELLIEVRQEGNEVVITFSDDGGGLNIPRIRQRAESLGLLPAGADVSERDVAEIIFEPGFSTATQVTEIAGRGVGMDVVRSEAAALGGRIDLDFTPGSGTRFTIYLPLTLAITQVVLVRAGERLYAIPSVVVEQVQQLKPQALANAYNERGIVWHNSRIEMYYLSALLGDKVQVPMAQRYSPIMILRSGIHRVVIHVDEIIGNLEAVVKNIGPQLARVPGIAGATVLGTGEIVLILNPVQLALTMAVEARSHVALAGVHQAEIMGAVAEILLPEMGAKQKSSETIPVGGLETMPIIMVVDDSLTVRKVTQRLLTREGYQVVLAKDGVDALRQMQDYTPAVMLVDIEMPRMDGFDLTRNIRGDERFKQIPIIMITSRTADKHRNYAMSLGVNVYLGKPYQEPELLQHIQHFIREQKAARGAA